MPSPRFYDLTAAQLNTFCLVMREGGYAAAAKVCGLSVPTVWQQVQAIERVYGVKLFEKTGRSIKPTAPALALYRQIDPILVSLESTFDRLEDSIAAPIRIVSGVRMMLEDLARPFARFRESHDNVLVICQGSDKRAEELLLNDQADLAFALQPNPQQANERLHYESVYTVDFLVVSPPEHSIMKADTLRLVDLAKQDLIVTRSGSHGRSALEQAFHREGLKPRVVVETDNSAFTVACVAAGMGIGILAGNAQGYLRQNLQTRSAADLMGVRSIVAMWRKGLLLSPAMKDLIDEVKAIGGTVDDVSQP
ncbi:MULTISPECIES: LysR family transcriptional regulator [Crateriforma]|uniref:HTH-type transcriptional activator CmpR n=1 Tax=Crateriforma conspicua TaxID=2527996 RepID=A0A5C6FVV3_9PLAN|nr:MULTISPECIES: LysR family transcriptional regulator [Crateriforma]TWU65765.1 HTH-type transcriptional activator CmpR [Crateriforma conspicua]